MKHIKGINEAAPLTTRMSEPVSKYQSYDIKGLYNKISSTFEDIRNVLVDFEDTRTINYLVNGTSFNPSNKDVKSFIKDIILSLLYSEPKPSNFTISCNIALKSESIDKSQRLSTEGIDLLDDVIVASRRISSLGHSVSLEFGSDNFSTEIGLHKSCKLFIRIDL